jgi:hypothetical protein
VGWLANHDVHARCPRGLTWALGSVDMDGQIEEDLDFLNTLGREFCIALQGSVSDDFLSSQDCYSVVSSFLSAPLTPHLLKALTHAELLGVTQAFNRYFECTTIEFVQIKEAVNRTLWHWQDGTP